MMDKEKAPQKETAQAYNSSSGERELAENTALTSNDIYHCVLDGYPDVLNVLQASSALGISKKMLYRLLNDGTLRSLKIGREFKIPKFFILQYLQVIPQSADPADMRS